MAAYQYIYVMKGLTKIYPGGREVLEDIWLSFLPGAKIGVLGLNGAGKSTLLQDHGRASTQDFVGEAWAAEGATVGFLPQEPRARPDQGRARATSRRAWRETKALLDRFEEVSAELRRADRRRRDGQADRPSRPSCRTRSTPPTPGTSTARSRSPWTRCAARPATPTSTKLSGGERRRVALCRLLLQQPGPAAARRAHQPSRRRIGGLARALPAGLHGHGGRGHPRPLLPRQRRRLDPGARPRPGHPLEGQLLLLARAEAEAAGAGGDRRRRRQRTLARELEWVRQSPRARQAKSKARLTAYEELLARPSEQARPRPGADHHPAGPRLGDLVVEAEHLRKGYGDRLLIDDLDFRLPPGGIVGVIGPNGAGKTTLFRMITGQEKPDARQRSGSATRSSSPTSTRAATRSTPNKTVWEEISGGARPDRARQAQDAEPRLRRAPSTSRAPTSRRRSASSRAASATACTWPRC